MIIKWADCLITESKIHNHIMGGILIWSHVQNKIIVNKWLDFRFKIATFCLTEKVVFI